jgi:hypothetical protein
VIRALLAVALALALVAVSLPVVDDARTGRAAARADATLTTVERAARGLVTGEDATAPDLPGARRRVTVRLPVPSWSTAGVAWLSVGGRPGGRGNRSLLAYRVSGGGVRTVRLAGVRLRTPGGPVTFRAPGGHALRLALRRDGVPVVVAERD